jgi:hypothetical protein
VTEIPPPRLGSTRVSRILHEFLASRSDATLVRAARRWAEASVALLHSENVDPRTNGEFEVLRRLGSHGLQTVIDLARTADGGRARSCD